MLILLHSLPGHSKSENRRTILLNFYFKIQKVNENSLPEKIFVNLDFFFEILELY